MNNKMLFIVFEEFPGLYITTSISKYAMCWIPNPNAFQYYYFLHGVYMQPQKHTLLQEGI